MALPIFQRTVVNDKGDVIPGAQVTVRIESSGALATIYSDRNGTVPLSNPLRTDSSGLARFYAVANEYKITSVGNGTSVEWRYVVVIDTNDIAVVADNQALMQTVSDNIVDIQNAEENAISASGSAATAAGYAEVLAYNFEPTVKPILDLDFANQEYSEWEIPTGKTSKPLVDVLDVTNGSASYTDPTGMTRTTSANTARLTYDAETGVSEGLLVEESRTNLATYPSDFNESVWDKGNLTVFPNLLESVNGSISADKVIPNSDSVGHYISRSYATTLGQNYTYSWVVKAGEYTGFSISVDSTSQAFVAFNLINGTKSSGGGSYYFDSGMKQLRNGFYLCWLSFTAQSTTATIQGRVIKTPIKIFEGFAGDEVSGIYVAYAQFEKGSFPTSYIPDATIFNSRASTATYYDSTGTLQTAATNVARYSYNPANLKAEPVLLLEKARTNLFTYSEDLNTGWVVSNGLLTLNAATDKFGLSNAAKVEVTAGSNPYLSKAFTYTLGTVYCHSVYVEAPNEKTISTILYGSVFNNGGSNVNAVFELSGYGEVVSKSCEDAGIQYLGDNIYRIWTVQTATATATTSIQLVRLASSINGEFCYTSLPQIEQGSYPTSYIPTTTTQVTRAADLSTGVQATRAGDSITRDLSTLDGFTEDKGTVYIEFSSKVYTSFHTILSVGNLFNITQSTQYSVFSPVFISVLGEGTTTPYAQDEVIKVCATYDNVNLQTNLIVNGEKQGITQPTKRVLSSGLLEFARNSGSLDSCHKIYKFEYRPQVLSEAEAIALTS